MLKKTLHAINLSLRFLIKTRDRQINKSALRIGMHHPPVGFAFRLSARLPVSIQTELCKRKQQLMRQTTERMLLNFKRRAKKRAGPIPKFSMKIHLFPSLALPVAIAAQSTWLDFDEDGN